MSNRKYEQFTYEGKTYICELNLGEFRRILLRVRQDGTIRLTAPIWITAERRTAFLKKYMPKAIEAVKAMEERKRSAVPEVPTEDFTDGGRVLYLGRILSLQLLPARQGQRRRVVCTLDRENRPSVLMLNVLPAVGQEAIKKAILDWKKERLLALIESYRAERIPTLFADALDRYAAVATARYLLRPTAIRVHAMTCRWGSCNAYKGTLNFNLWLINAPIGCIEYVIVHEFAHFLYPNHSVDFHALLTDLLPDWKDRRALLNQTRIPNG